MEFNAIRACRWSTGGDSWRGAVRFPAPTEVHVWFADIERRSDTDRLLLSFDEGRRADRFRFDRDRDRFTAARATLRRLLALYLGAGPRGYEFGYGVQGKPCLAGAFLKCGLEFNVAHAQGLAAYAFASGRPVGIDIETVKNMADADEIAQRFFSAPEACELSRLGGGEKSLAFFNGWTRKEAFVKAVGEGLSYPLDRFEVSLGGSGRLVKIQPGSTLPGEWSLCGVEAPSGYVAAVAAALSTFTVVGPRIWPGPEPSEERRVASGAALGHPTHDSRSGPALLEAP
jgi:4'-phosphopantetheinyl transferase